ncbi:DNA primase [Thermodesulfovibrionales bacterium]|nr:DNA primase [Thermodesulfovibrionales bacterium]
MKSDSLISDIKAKIDIVDLVSEHLDLKRAGQNYKGLCPFHLEKTPSFTVSQSKQIFHCFGCSKGGDIFTFVMEHENMTFSESISYLADKAGLKIEDFQIGSKATKGAKEGLFAIYKEATAFFKDNLRRSNRAIAYLKQRGLTSETIEEFSIGYSKGERDLLFNHLKRQGFPLEHIKASGIVYFDKDVPYDFFRERLMFPIFDLQGRVVAFGGRTLSALKNLPKYINSPDSIIFKKGEFSYGLNIAKKFIIQKDYSNIVEGYIDVLICHQYGFGNVIAPLGTALTSGQARKIKRFSNNLLLIFDGDFAGVSAAKRAIELCSKEGMTAKVLLLPEGKDPDAFIRENGEEYFKRYIGRAISPVEFLVNASGENKLDAVRHVLHLISSCPDPLQRDKNIQELSDRSKINEIALREELGNISQRAAKTGVLASPLSKISQREPLKVHEIKNEERILLNISLLMPEKANSIVCHLDPGAIDDPVIKGIFEKMKISITSNTAEEGYPSIEGLMAICSGEEQKVITMLSTKSEFDEEKIDENIKDCFKKIALKQIERQIREAGQRKDERLLSSLIMSRKNLLEKPVPQ